MKHRRASSCSLALSIACAVIAGCGRGPDTTAEYQAICHGPPLRTVEARNQALEDGYEVIRMFDCIGKASYAERIASGENAAAARTPAAIARRQQEREAMIAEERARRAAEDGRKSLVPPSTRTYAVTRPVEANTASEDELASVLNVGASTARQIVAQRDKRPFDHWPDLVRRVVGLSAARPALYASIGGLVVNGRGLDGAPFDPQFAAQLDPSQPITPYVASRLQAMGL